MANGYGDEIPTETAMARRMSRRLVALSTAAIATVFSVGYVHTESAAAHLAAADSLATVTPRIRTEPLPATAPVVAAATATPFPDRSGSARNVLIGTARRSDEGDGGGGRERRNGDAPQILRPAPTRVPAPATTPLHASQATRYRDGSYSGMGENRHGDVQVTVVISGGRIASAAIADCGMQYPCSRIAMLPGEVLSRQSINVDLVSGATMSSTAYQDAVLQALAKATA